ncbi:hypothetical protein C922_00236 [Plasmodium inui San Antonio 1]|uniref:Pv-fam-g protein n=1 Tax=Plasmodium inui San Antonio 1 TaxID=1237626 RepID=W7ADH3_9APIC|nr:hypothetical protein C922_00236 [Plasmodium inui San Antonio 1]EUD69373.1 hypothetical protein C922_00236 [Plasmodium inui San Antonio 1]
MDHLVYYVMVQQNSIQPIIVRQPPTVIIHTQPNPPITLDLPPQNIILKNDEPQPIIVRQQNPNIIMQKSGNEFSDNSNYALSLNHQMKELTSMTNLNTAIPQGTNEPLPGVTTPEMNEIIDPPYIYSNQYITNQNKSQPMNNMYFTRVPLNNDGSYCPYNMTLYPNKREDYMKNTASKC